MCWDFTVSVYALEYVFWHGDCWSWLHPSRFAYLFDKCVYAYYLFLSSVYRKLGYIELVERATELSMRASVDEVQALPEYATKGEVLTAK